MNWPPGTHSNTFVGNLLASTAVLTALNFMERVDLGTMAKQRGGVIYGAAARDAS